MNTNATLQNNQISKNKFSLLIRLLVITLVTTACSTNNNDEVDATNPPTAEPVASGVIVFGDIDADDPVAKLEEFQPIADYVAANLTDYGIGVGEVKIAPDLETMISWVAAGEVNLYYDSLYPAMIVRNEANAEPLLRGWRGGEPIYHSVFFTRVDSGITTLDDLNGQLIAYDDIASTSGYMIPTAYLLSNGLNLVEKTSLESVVAEDEVGYIFS